MIGAGELNRVISIQSNSPSTFTAEGEPVASWSTVLTDIWAKYEPLSGREFFLAAQRYAENMVRFVIRYTTSITMTETLRVKYGSDYYDVKYIKDIADERTNYELLCEKIIA